MLAEKVDLKAYTVFAIAVSIIRVASGKFWLMPSVSGGGSSVDNTRSKLPMNWWLLSQTELAWGFLVVIGRGLM